MKSIMNCVMDTEDNLFSTPRKFFRKMLILGIFYLSKHSLYINRMCFREKGRRQRPKTKRDKLETLRRIKVLSLS